MMAPHQFVARIKANLRASAPQLRHNCRFALATKLEQRILSQVTPAIRGMSLESAH
jgi:hypothetical protein